MKLALNQPRPTVAHGKRHVLGSAKGSTLHRGAHPRGSRHRLEHIATRRGERTANGARFVVGEHAPTLKRKHPVGPRQSLL